MFTLKDHFMFFIGKESPIHPRIFSRFESLKSHPLALPYQISTKRLKLFIIQRLKIIVCHIFI